MSAGREGLVWPGVTAALWQQSTPLMAEDSSKQLRSQFSFDWSRGVPSSSSKRDSRSTMPFLSGFGEGLPFASRQRWKHFVALLLLSCCMFVLAGAFLPLVLLRPQKFCLFFTLGSMLSMASFAVLRGPLEQLKHMFSLQRCARARTASQLMRHIISSIFIHLLAPTHLLRTRPAHTKTMCARPARAGCPLRARTSAPWPSPSTPRSSSTRISSSSSSRRCRPSPSLGTSSRMCQAARPSSS